MIVEEGQNIVDVAIQEYGAFEAIFQLFLDNPHLENLNVIFDDGQEITIVNSSLFENTVVRAEYKKRNYKVRTDTQILNLEPVMKTKVHVFDSESSTTKSLDFSAVLDANKSHSVDLFEVNGATETQISLGVKNGTTDDDATNVTMTNPFLVINPSEVTFAFANLLTSKTYKVVIQQIENN